MKGWVKVTIGVLAAFFAFTIGWAMIVTREPERLAAPSGAEPRPASTPSPTSPASFEVAPGLSIGIVASTPPDAELLCSKCYKPFPRLLVRVVPTWIEGNGYVGSFRCNLDAPKAIVETGERLARAEPAELESFFRVVSRRAVEPARVAKLRSGSATPSRADARVVLDAIERGEIVLAP